MEALDSSRAQYDADLQGISGTLQFQDDDGGAALDTPLLGDTLGRSGPDTYSKKKYDNELAGVDGDLDLDSDSWRKHENDASDLDLGSDNWKKGLQGIGLGKYSEFVSPSRRRRRPPAVGDRGVRRVAPFPSDGRPAGRLAAAASSRRFMSKLKTFLRGEPGAYLGRSGEVHLPSSRSGRQSVVDLGNGIRLGGGGGGGDSELDLSSDDWKRDLRSGLPSGASPPRAREWPAAAAAAAQE